MKELLYAVLELEEWNKEVNCSFCSNLDNKAVCQIRTRSKLTDRILENDEACENCKEKFENDELPKCENCGRLKTKLNIDCLSGNYTCDCKEKAEEKEFPILPVDRRPGAFYERQINALREEKATAEEIIEEERAAHEDFMKVSEKWGKKQKQELLDKIAKLEEENKQLREEKKVELYEKEITELREQLKQLTSQQQQTAQMETPVKDNSNKIRNLFKFGSK